MPNTFHHALLAGCTAMLAAPAITAAERSDQETALELINPISGLTSFYNGFEFRNFQGSLPQAGDQDQGYYTLTSSVPFELDNGKRIVVRASLPISFGTPTYETPEDDLGEWQIRKVADTLPTDGYFISGHGHLDDITWDVAYGGVSDSGLITMIGVAGAFPTSQDGSIERDQYLLGPEFAIGKVSDWGTYGVWLKHWVDVADVSGRDVKWSTNETYLKFFFAYGLGNGWNIIANPEIEYDWEGAGSNKLYLPIGGGISKTTEFWRVPVKMDLELYNYIESPDAFGPEWMLTFAITPVWQR